MNKEYIIRKKKAKEINKKIKDLCVGVTIVGSVAYSSKAVTNKSDLDMVIILNFKEIDFKEFYRRINQKFEPVVIEHASKRKFNNFSIVFDEEFEIGLHLWDITAFKNVINLKKKNLIFRRDNFNRNFRSVSDHQIFKSLSGKEKKVYKKSKKVKGGKIIDFLSYIEEKGEFYPDIQIHNLILSPTILSEKNKIITKGIKQLKENIKKKLDDLYPKRNKGKINFVNSLPEKIRNKTPLRLKKQLMF